jgi:hypothetical protein
VTQVKSKSKSRTKSSSATAIKSMTKRKVTKRMKTFARPATKQPQVRAFIGFDSAGRMSTMVLDETGAFGVTENFVAIPVTSLRVEETRAGARLLVMDLSSPILLPAPTAMPTEKFDPGKIRLQTLELTKQTADRVSEIGHRVVETTSELSKKFSDSAIGHKAVETATELGKKAADKASEIGHRIAETTSELSKKVAASAIGQKTVETATELGKKAADKASEIGLRVAATTSELSKKVADSAIGQKAVGSPTELGKKTAEAATKLAHKTANTGAPGQQAAETLGQRNEEAVAKDKEINADDKQPSKFTTEK